ncbi:MAG: hypothetical protein AAGA93_18100 [Actinomycetota bacterium]
MALDGGVGGRLGGSSFRLDRDELVEQQREVGEVVVVERFELPCDVCAVSRLDRFVQRPADRREVDDVGPAISSTFDVSVRLHSGHDLAHVGLRHSKSLRQVGLALRAIDGDRRKDEELCWCDPRVAHVLLGGSSRPLDDLEQARPSAHRRVGAFRWCHAVDDACANRASASRST